MNGYALLRAPPLVLIIACLVRFAYAPIGRWFLLINSAHIVKESLRFWPGVRVLSLPHNHPGTLLTQALPKSISRICVRMFFDALSFLTARGLPVSKTPSLVFFP